MNFPTEYTRPYSEQSINELFKIEADYRFCFWRPGRILGIKKIIGKYNPDFGLYFYIYSHNSMEVIVVKHEH